MTVKTRIHYAVVTDIGLCRTSNQDAFLASAEIGLYAVADGMGGPPGGDVASRTAVTVLFEWAATHNLPAGRHGALPPDRLLREGFRQAQDVILEEVAANPRLVGMGTTLVAAIIVGSTMTVAHIGDSRAYLYRNDVLRPLTEDHSVVNKAVRRGLFSRADARRDPRRNLLSRVVGCDDSAEPDLATITLHGGDQLLLCTDGLTGLLDDADIARCLSRRAAPLDQCRRLVEGALNAGGIDNVTVVLVSKASLTDPSHPSSSSSS